MIIGIVAHNPEFLQNLLRSLQGVKYPVLVVHNELGCDGYELGALKLLAKIDDVFLLQDSTEIKDLAVFDLAAAAPGGFGLAQQFQCFLGKYMKSVLDRMDIPETTTKAESIIQETEFHQKYTLLDPDLQYLQPVLHDHRGRKEVKFNRDNLVLENDYIIKYKGNWGQSQ